jgi:deazaflavin-dependent oxidoreductase (nitroreductase family)
MSIRQRLGAVVVALFAIAFTRLPGLIRRLGPIMNRLLLTPLPAGPNALLEVRGRKSGRIRRVPVAYLDLGDRTILQAASAHAGWTADLRRAGAATLLRGGRRNDYAARELDPEAGGQLLHDLLAPFPKSGLVRTIVGPFDRPPVGILWAFRLRIDDSLEACIANARRQPIFELRPS